jgi:hypothetical protein
MRIAVLGTGMVGRAFAERLDGLGHVVTVKAAGTDLLRSFGHTDVIDLGDISTARGAEMILPLWLRLWNAVGTPRFSFKIVR